jgi:hypothetical protein
MVERSQRQSFESFERTRLLEVDEFEECHFERLVINVAYLFAILRNRTYTRRAIADRSVNVRRFISYTHLSSPFLRNSHSACNHDWLKVRPYYVYSICSNHSQFLGKFSCSVQASSHATLSTFSVMLALRFQSVGHVPQILEICYSNPSQHAGL